MLLHKSHDMACNHLSMPVNNGPQSVT